MADSVEERMELIQAASRQFNYLVYLDSNDYPDQYGKFSWILMAGNQKGIHLTGQPDDWKQFSDWIDQTKGRYRAGFIGYHAGTVQKPDDVSGFPIMGFFEPSFVRGQKRNGESVCLGELPEFEKIHESEFQKRFPGMAEPKPVMDKHEYVFRFEQIRKNLHRGNIYEVNFCQAFDTMCTKLDPIGTWVRLNKISPAPFACIVKYSHSWLIGSSPERFMCKRDLEIISQPIKGTVRRTGDSGKDLQMADKMAQSAKERSENIMIVDLVRNDLSATLVPGSVQVKELCGIYPFARVIHLISTISGKLKTQVNGVETIQQAFPMGSMTGAPKIRAMEIANEYEPFNRGIYSGSVGLFDPDEDFDFNVVIRSITWNERDGHLRIAAGSAVTAAAEAESEYEECLLKAESMLECLGYE